MCNPKKHIVIKPAHRISWILILLSSLAYTTFAQESTLNNRIGEWSDDASWSDGSSPGATIDGIDVEVYGSITLNGDFDLNKATLTVYDTLLICGNFKLLNNGILVIGPSGVLIISGDYTSDNKVEVNNAGYFIVTGNFEMLGSDNQGTFSNMAKVFIFDANPEIKGGVAYSDLECTDPNNYPLACGYGNEEDIVSDPIYDFFSQSNCTNCIFPFQLNPPADIFIECTSEIPSAHTSYSDFIAAGGSIGSSGSIDTSSFVLESESLETIDSETIITRTYQMSDFCRNSVSADQIITIKDNTPPIIICPDDIEICAVNNSGVAINGLAPTSLTDNCSPEAAIAYNYQVTGATSAMGIGSSSSIFFNVGLSTLTYTATDENGNSSNSSFSIKVNPTPSTSIISGDLSPSCGATNEAYSVTGSTASKYFWSLPPQANLRTDTSGTGVSSISVDFGATGGIISVQEVSEFGCDGVPQSENIQLQGCELIAQFNADKTDICVGDTVTFTNTSLGVSGTTVYSWGFGAGASPSIASGSGPHKVVFEASGTKTISLRIISGTTESISKDLSVRANPTINISGEDLCGEGDAQITAISNTATQIEFSTDGGANIHRSDNTYPFSYTQFLSEGDSLALVARATIIGVGCQSDWSEQVMVKSIAQRTTGEIIAESNNEQGYLDLVCSNETKKYVVDGDKGDMYRWKVEELGIDVLGTSEFTTYWNYPGGEYTLSTQLQANDVCNGSLSEGIVFIADPVIDLGPDQNICMGDSYTFEVPKNLSSYLWHDNSSDASFTSNSSIYVSLTVTNEYGCESQDNCQLTVQPLPLIDLGPDTSLCVNESLELVVGDFVQYNWSTGETGNSTSVYADAGTISLTVFDKYGCAASDEITIIECSIPQAIANKTVASLPGISWVNNNFIISNIEQYSNIEISLYDKMGRIMFHTQNGNKDSLNGTMLPVGNYYYVIDIHSSELASTSGALAIIY